VNQLKEWLVTAVDGQGVVPVFYRAGGVFDGVSDGVRRGEGVLVGDGRVLAVGPASELAGRGVVEVDLGDRVVVPGFIDSHTHITIRPWEGDQHGKMMQPPVWQTIRGVQNLQRMLQSGVTTAKIMSERHNVDYEFRDAVARGEVVGPRLRVCGPGLSPPGGHGSAGGGVAGVADLRAAVAERAALGADHIKIFTTGGVSTTNTSLEDSNYSAAEIAAIVDEAAAHGLKVSAHAHGGAGVSLAVQNGIHSIEHGGMLNAENLALMAEHNTWLVMTHTILFHPEGIEGGDAHEPAILEKVKNARAFADGNVGNIRDAGISRIAVGTDSMHGLFGFELQWLVEHGWTPLQAMIAATSGGAELLGVEDIGVLREGARADFVVLDGDPLEDITAVYNVTAVYQDGIETVQGKQITPRLPAPRRHLPTPGGAH
jgi:imidazolonepropionase-like amidohydrolase